MADTLPLLKALMQKDVYNAFASSTLSTLFEGELEEIFRGIVFAHEKYEGDLQPKDVDALVE